MHHSMYLKTICSSLLFACALALPLLASAQSANTLPIATTLQVSGADNEGGQVTLYDEATNGYFISANEKDARVYGVTAVSPALVFTTSSGTIPVVTSGPTQVRVTTSNGIISRGDLLESSALAGTAMKADLSDDQVFAVALESFGTQGISNESGSIIASIGIDQAHALQVSRRELEKRQSLGSSSSSTASKSPISIVRAGIAAIIAVGGLLFILYSFRSTIAKGVVSIGRNPRARTSIMALSFGNIIFALILCAVVIFIAIGVLVLPV